MFSTFQTTLWQIGVPLTWKAQACNDCVEFTQPEGVGALHISGARKTDGPVLDAETSMRNAEPSAAPNPRIASRFTIGHHRPGVGEPERAASFQTLHSNEDIPFDIGHDGFDVQRCRWFVLSPALCTSCCRCGRGWTAKTSRQISASCSHFIWRVFWFGSVTQLSFEPSMRFITLTPNKPAAPNPAIASRLAIRHRWPGVGEPGRSPK